MRIVGGEFSGRSLAAPKGSATRPTSDRTRESIFNVLSHRYPESLAGARILDLFAGTGALGIEALSRGGTYCVFVEESVEGRGIIRANVEAFGLTGRTKILRRDATHMGSAGTFQPFGLVFADPPYGKELGDRALRSAAVGGWLTADALCVVEEAADAAFDAGPGFETIDRRDYGDTTIRFLRACLPKVSSVSGQRDA